MPQLPFMREQRRAARPTSPIGQLAPGRHIGITAGVPMGRKSHIASIGITSPRHMACGGIVQHYDDGGPISVPNALGEANVNDQYLTIPTADAAIPGSNQLSQPSPSYVEPVLTPTGGGVLSAIGSALAGSSGSDDSPLLGSRDTDAQMASQQPGGFGGWLSSKHGGIAGKDWLQALLTAGTGILSGIANKRASKQVPKIGLNGFAQGGNVHMTSPNEPAVYMASGGNVHMNSPMEPKVWMADGGQVPQQAPQQDQQKQMIAANAVKALLGQSQNPQADLQAFAQVFGQQALQQLVEQVKQHQGQGQPQGGGIAQGQTQQQGMSHGGALFGPGDGMSDSISANDGKIALSDGERVLDAATVSDIGNGSNSAGQAKIEQAIKELRMRKHGRTSQPPRIADHNNPVLNNLRS